MNEKLKKTNESIFIPKEFEEYPRISDLEDCIKETVIGQDQLVKSIATSLYNEHYMDVRCVDLIIGGCGTGKTLTMQAFGKEMGLAYTMESATQYTQEGYHGDSVNRMLSNLLKNAEYDFERAENGILMIDEIGKKTTKGRGGADGRDISGEGVLDSLLPLLSGAPINIEVQNRQMQFETKNLKIFLMDACSGLDEIREKRLENKKFGFSTGYNKDLQSTLSPSKRVYTKEDLIKYGFTPEFVSRINKIHVTNPIDVDTMIRIQKESKIAIHKKYEAGLYKRGIKLIRYPEFFKEIAEATLNHGTGARELDNTTIKAFEEFMYRIYNTSIGEIKVVELLPGIANDNTKYALY